MIGDFTRESDFSPPLDRSKVWGFIHDEKRVSACSRHIEDVHVEEARSKWTARLISQVGRFKVAARVGVETVEEEDNFIRIEAHGHDRQIGTRLHVNAVLRLRGERPDERGLVSRLHLEGKYEVTGKVANLGSGLVQRQANRMVNDFWGEFCDTIGNHARTH